MDELVLIYMYYIYILHCNDGSYYTGVTNNPERRVWEHNQGLTEDAYTKSRLPTKLEYFEEYLDVREAIMREKQIKGWVRKKKIALIKGNIGSLSRYSRSHGSTSSS